MLDQKLQQRLLQKLSPQQIQVIKLLEIPTIELEQRIKKELEENPVLEEGADEDETFDNTDESNDDDNITDLETENIDKKNEDDEFNLSDYIADDDDIPAYNLKTNNHSKDNERKEIPFANNNSYHDSLKEQAKFRFVDDKYYPLIEYIIDNLDEDGYLRREISAMVDDLAFLFSQNTNEEELEKALSIVHKLDPPGSGARNLQECLLIQLKRKDNTNKTTLLAKEIIENCFEEFSKKHYEKIIKKLDITDEELKTAVNEILKLNPKPGSAYSDAYSKDNIQITPDFTTEYLYGKLYVSLNSYNSPELRINSAYKEMFNKALSEKEDKAKNNQNKELSTFIKQKIDSANWFIDALRQRRETMMLVMNAIVHYQEKFFEEGDETFLRPMILKDIADITNLDISTVSRVANSKYVQTQHGIFSLKYFFSESMQNDSGEEVSTKEIKKIMQEIIEVEDKSNPYTDEELSEKLKEKGYPIARRTIAKYREQLNIPVGRLRKEL